MADRTCSRDYCDNPVFARTLCTSCYRFYSESGLLDLVAPLRYERHYLSNIDEEARVGDCSVCGPGAKLKRRTGTGSRRWKWQCKTVSKRNKGRTAGRRKSAGRKLVTTEEWNRMVEEVNGRCQICMRSEDLVLDHCHDTMTPRGILCRACNLGIGFLKDDAALVAAALDYLTP